MMLYQNIFLSLEGNREETRLIAETMRMVTALEADLTVIHINDPNAGMGHMMPDPHPNLIEEDLVKEFNKAGYSKFVQMIKFQIIEGGSLAKAITTATRDADLLIMGHHSKNALLAFLTDSVDERVADKIHCPILLVPLE